MNYQKKYYFSFKDLKNVGYTVEIWQDITATLNPVEVRGAAQPFVIEYASLENKITPVRGSGATINMIATASNSFIDLYTGKIKEFLVKCYRGASLVWCGYLDSETYGTDFAQYDNYPVSFTASDGFALLERINYIDDTLKPYSGISSQWTVLTNVLTKMNLPINNILIGLSTVSNDFTLAYNQTLFHKTLVINDNYVNETNEPETCRKVLEGILQPYGAFIAQVNGSIIITDLNFIANNNNQPFEAFNPVNFTGLGQSYIDLNIGDLSTIGFRSDSSPFSIVSALNKIVVSYSNYKGVDLIDTKQDDFKVPGAVTTKGAANYQWTETVNGSCDSWTKSGNGRFITLAGIVPQNDTDNYLSTGATTNKDLLISKSFTYQKQLPYLIPSTDYRLKIEMSTYFRSTDDLNKPSDPAKHVFNAGRVMARLKIGNKYLTSKVLGDHNYPASHSNSWITTDDLTVAHNFALYFYSQSSTITTNWATYGDISDQWINLNDFYFVPTKGIQSNDFLIDLAGLSGGLLTLEIWDGLTWSGDDYGFVTNGSYLKEVRIKDVKLTVVDKLGKELSVSDMEYFSALDPAFKDDYKIDLIHGTNVSKCPIEKGSLLFDNGTQYAFCQSWTRSGQTSILEKLLQNTVKSNYLNPSIQLVCTVNSLPSLIGVVHYQSQLPGKSFMISSAKINLEDNATELTLQEVSKDILTVL